jgi:hypothetical protein
MIDTTRRDPARERIEAGLREHFGSQVDRIDRAAERFEAARAKLYRSDGQPIYGPEEHRQRLDALLGEFDAVGAAVTGAAEEAIAEAEGKLAILEGGDPLDGLKPDELDRANRLAAFIREDAEALPHGELAKRLRAVLAAGDRPKALLWARYLDKRLEAERGRPGTSSPDVVAVFEAARELRASVADPKAAEAREEAGRRKGAAQVLRWRVTAARSRLDGSEAAALEDMRRRYAF